MMIIVKVAADCNSARTYADICAFSAVRKRGWEGVRANHIHTMCGEKKTKLYRIISIIFYKDLYRLHVVAVNKQHDVEQIVAANGWLGNKRSQTPCLWAMPACF